MSKKKTSKRKKPGEVPRPSTVVEEFQITSPKGAKYLVKRTTQTDIYDKKARKG